MIYIFKIFSFTKMYIREMIYSSRMNRTSNYTRTNKHTHFLSPCDWQQPLSYCMSTYKYFHIINTQKSPPTPYFVSLLVFNDIVDDVVRLFKLSCPFLFPFMTISVSLNVKNSASSHFNSWDNSKYSNDKK